MEIFFYNMDKNTRQFFIVAEDKKDAWSKVPKSHKLLIEKRIESFSHTFKDEEQLIDWIIFGFSDILTMEEMEERLRKKIEKAEKQVEFYQEELDREAWNGWRFMKAKEELEEML